MQPEAAGPFLSWHDQDWLQAAVRGLLRGATRRFTFRTMNSKGQNKGQLALFFERPSGNPYSRISDDQESEVPLPRLVPHPVAQKTSARDSVASTLCGELDDVLAIYRPYVARGEWNKVLHYRDEFLREATRMPEKADLVRSRLKRLRVELLPMEKIECNRAPAERIIAELRQLLG